MEVVKLTSNIGIAEWLQQEAEEQDGQAIVKVGSSGQIVVHKLDLSRVDWTDRRLENIVFEGHDETYSICDFSKTASMAAVTFRKFRTFSPKLPGSKATKIGFESCVLKNANLNDATAINFSHCEVSDSHLRKTTFTGMSESTFSVADLHGGKILDGSDRSKLRTAFTNCDLTDFDFGKAWLTNCTFTDSTINHKTNVSRVAFDTNHSAMNDGAGSLKFRSPHNFINWMRLRWAVGLPIFGVSVVSTTLVLFIAIGIAWLNELRFLQTVTYPVPMPNGLFRALLASALLVFGSAIHNALCPARIRNFSEVQWREAMNHSSLLYRSEALKRPFASFLTSITLFPGGLLAGWIILERFWRAATILLS